MRVMSFRPFYQKMIFSCVILTAFASSSVFADSNRNEQKPVAEIVSKAAQEHQILYKLTTLDEFKKIVGQPIKETKKTDGGMEICDIEYFDISAHFGRMKEGTAPPTILRVGGKNGTFDIGENRQIVLRDTNDLNKFDSFWGFAGVSLINLDLRGHKKLLDDMPFDSLTKWPEPNRLPEGFEPARLLEEGKNPGLGIRNLHKNGVDGKGVGIAIIDQPLVRNHKELRDIVVQFEDIDVQNVGPQMHGPAVTSIAVGKTCGVAPAASLVYYAIPMWQWNSCRPYCDVINKILELNKTLKDSEKIRVVSISMGMFSAWPDFDIWKQIVEKANNHGILVVTCDDKLFVAYGMLKRNLSGNPDDPNAYLRGRYSSDEDVLRVPGGNRTIASQVGPEVYKFDRAGGMSWGAPYLAGLAALAFQVNPQIEPNKIVELWLKTAVHTDAGPVVNPVGFIEAVRKLK